MFFSFQEWYYAHKYVPTIGQMKDVYNLPDKDHETYEHKKDFLLWYVDRYLPAAAGDVVYGKKIRSYFKVTDIIEIDGKKRVYVESASEAFGWLLLENCYDKWCQICPKKRESPSWKVPKYKKKDPATHPYNKCKWSDSTAGQGAGWAPGAREALNSYKEIIRKFRNEDHANKWKVHNFCLQLIRETHGITEDTPMPKGSKKRKRPAQGPAASDFMDMENDSDDVYSVHSEDSSGEQD